MSDFSFIGRIPPSKSLFNRALIVQSFYPDFKIIGESHADDVTLMQTGLKSLAKNELVDCGEAGTVLRFLSLRAARQEGVHVLTGSDRLFSRPQDELLKILRQLGCQAEFRGSKLHIESWGWRDISCRQET